MSSVNIVELLKIPTFLQNLYYKCSCNVQASIILPEPAFDAHNYPNVWAGWVLLSHFTDEEVEVNRV